MRKAFWLTSLSLGLASHAPADLVITEVVEGNLDNLKYVEIKNTGASAVDLTSPQVALRRFTTGGSGTGATIHLTGTIPAGGSFLIAHNQADLDPYLGTNTVTA